MCSYVFEEGKASRINEIVQVKNWCGLIRILGPI
jgi:hypothetical protein